MSEDILPLRRPREGGLTLVELTSAPCRLAYLVRGGTDALMFWHAFTAKVLDGAGMPSENYAPWNRLQKLCDEWDSLPRDEFEQLAREFKPVREWLGRCERRFTIILGTERRTRPELACAVLLLDVLEWAARDRLEVRQDDWIGLNAPAGD